MAIIPEDKDGPKKPMTAALSRDPVCTVLRRAREAAGYEIADVAQLLRIQRPYLEAIEEGRYSDLPGTVYAIGFVRTYSDFLSLDTTEMVRWFKEEATELSKRTDYVFPVAPAEARVPGMGILVVGVLLAALAYGGWYVSSDDEDRLVDQVSEIPDRFTELASRGDAPAQSGTDTPAPEADLRTAADGAAGPESAGDPSVAPPDLDALAAMAAGRQSDAADTTAVATDTAPAGPVAEEAPVELTTAPVEPAPPVETAASTPPAPSPDPIVTPQSVETIQRIPPSVPAPTPSSAFEVAEAAPGTVSATGQPKAATESSAGQPEVASLPPPSGANSPMNILPSGPASVAEPPPPPPALQPAQPRSSSLGDLNSRIQIRAVEMSWVQITDDRGNLVMTRVLEPGESYRVPNTDGLTLASGNAGGLEVLVDGVVQQPLGLRGTVVRNVDLDPDSLRARGTN